MKGTVTVTVRRGQYYSRFSALPGREFGPYPFAEMVRGLRISALLPGITARNLVMDAAVQGEATTEVGQTDHAAHDAPVIGCPDCEAKDPGAWREDRRP